MAKINSIDEALRAIWNPEVNILLLRTDRLRGLKNKLQRLNNRTLLEHLGCRTCYFLFPDSLYNLSLITKIQDGFLSHPLLQLDTPEPRWHKLEDNMWDEIHTGGYHAYDLYGSVNRKYYIGEKYRVTKLSSIDYTCAVHKTRTLLYILTQQSPQCSNLERILHFLSFK